MKENPTTVVRRTVFTRKTNAKRWAASESVLDAIGNTPLIRLAKLFADSHMDVYAKLESLNPSGSIKDRSAYNMLRHALDAGEIDSSATIVESSSGNLAIGLAQACCYLGLRLVCVVDTKTTKQNICILEAYGANVELISEPDPVTGEYLTARLTRVRQILDSIPNSYWPNQYANAENAGAHFQTTMAEIIGALDRTVDYLFVATSSCGTLRGCADYVRDHRLKTKVVAVDAMGSVIFGAPAGTRLFPGHGASIVPPLLTDKCADRVIHCSDLDCVVGCRRLLQSEAILAGASSGAVISAIERVADEIEFGALCVAILPDRGERYLDTVYSDNWVQANLGVDG